MKYVYPALISHDSEGYYIRFPDIENCFTDGDTLEEAIENANDVLPLMLCSMEDDKDVIPAPSPIADITPAEGEAVSLVYADTSEYRKKYYSKSVKRPCPSRHGSTLWQSVKTSISQTLCKTPLWNSSI